ncbi:MAG: hypothetical protein NZL94_03990 [Meiothermus sp.]|uniref:Vgb family protein n=1 Tax=Meiothermus sp. TaxID=1955249 RepID=UPI0026115280|nr:hypothetical protein [Meiothermus sp.]MCS7058029.1 hypothetical protein [Meiothermus sp.]
MQRQTRLVLAAALLLAACGGGATQGNNPGNNPGAGDCPTGGQGSLEVQVTGLPSGVQARVRVSGPGGYSRDLTGSQTLGVNTGTYTVQAERVIDTHPIVRQVYRVAQGAQTQVCVRNNETSRARVEYSLIPTSGKVWFGDATRSRVYGFSRDSLGTGGSVTPSPDADTRAYVALAFDREGNLWVGRQFGSEPHLYRYPAASLTGSSPTPDRQINVGGLAQDRRIDDMAFDPEGNLWVAEADSDTIFRLGRADLETAGSGVTTIAPGVIVSVDDPRSLAFDREGNLWVGQADSGAPTPPAVLRYDRSRLGSSIPAGQGPDRTLITLHWDGTNRLGNSDLAFDGQGNLWVMSLNSGTLHRLPQAVLSGTGSQTFNSPATDGVVRIFLGNGRLYGMAFDEGGGLWITYDPAGPGHRFARLSPGQLTSSTPAGSPRTPERLFDASSVSRTHSPALFPAPAGLPLFHSLP